MNQNNCRTATGKPSFSAVMQSMSRHVILPSAFGKEARNRSHNGSWKEIIPRRALKHLWNKISSGLFHFCPRLRAKVPLPPRTWWAGVFRGFVISPSPQTKSVNFFFHLWSQQRYPKFSDFPFALSTDWYKWHISWSQVREEIWENVTPLKSHQERLNVWLPLRPNSLHGSGFLVSGTCGRHKCNNWIQV